MARFSKSTLVQIAGFDNDVLCEELLYGVDDYWNLTITDGTTQNLPLDLTNWQFQFRLIRRSVTSINDSRQGLEIVGLGPSPGAVTMNLDDNVKVYSPTTGQLRLLINDSFFSQVPPVLDSDTPPCYSGYLGLTLPSVGTVGSVSYIPPQEKKILLFFIIRSDGVSSQANDPPYP